MKYTKLGSPNLRSQREAVQRRRLSTLDAEYLLIPDGPNSSVLEAVHARRSRRQFLPLSEEDISQLLWHSCRIRERRANDDGYTWEHRPAPSAGGLHPITILVVSRSLWPNAIKVYDPTAHTLAKLELGADALLQAFLDAVNAVLEIRDATVLWFVADFHLTLSKYLDGESLVWRDAGALGAIVEVVAEGLGLSCCALGITGEPFVSAITGNLPMLEGVGGCLVGRKVSDE
jgi:SagB-type dehydrogenase family enzyme